MNDMVAMEAAMSCDLIKVGFSVEQQFVNINDKR